MTLEERIKSDIDRISRVVADLKAAGAERGIHEAPALASYLSQFYTGIESCLEKKLKQEKIQLPAKSERYHKDLLTLAIKSKFIPERHSGFLDDLLSFRHFARHAYGVGFQADLVREKAARVYKAWPDLKPILQAPGRGTK